MKFNTYIVPDLELNTAKRLRLLYRVAQKTNTCTP